MPASDFLTGSVVWAQDPNSAWLICREICPLSSPSQAEHTGAKQLGEGLRRAAPGAAAVVAVQRRTAAPKELRVLTSSLWLFSRCSRPGSSRRDGPRGRSTRERWARWWRSRCSPAPRRPPGKLPAGGGSRCASAPPRPRHTARPGLSRGTRRGLDTEKKQSEQQRTKLKKKKPNNNANFFSYSFSVVFFPHFGANTHDSFD